MRETPCAQDTHELVLHVTRVCVACICQFLTWDENIKSYDNTLLLPLYSVNKQQLTAFYNISHLLGHLPRPWPCLLGPLRGLPDKHTSEIWVYKAKSVNCGVSVWMRELCRCTCAKAIRILLKCPDVSDSRASSKLFLKAMKEKIKIHGLGRHNAMYILSVNKWLFIS